MDLNGQLSYHNCETLTGSSYTAARAAIDYNKSSFDEILGICLVINPIIVCYPYKSIASIS